ncbi:hypothetical protein GYMLUDRAFT_671310 [Collybiopsis luxurians FD-317 M1]|uniref:F-box domain-containing protein n=1 Tax=Collybiopsis luxurians FD-317 M1 TaxID=944289 RepID=A0A0D0CLW5_9AGAR|nr:hypothetical protein GYMLUDRAFT_671310 [Collybiopsis luxurians FD-317 M1]
MIYPTATQTSDLSSLLDDRQFPDGICELVISGLSDDFDSLKNAALVCKDFAAMTRPHIFHTLTVRNRMLGSSFLPSPLLFRIHALLRDPKTVHFGKFVKTVDFDSSQFVDEHVSAMLFILQNVPTVSEIRMDLPRPEFSQAIGMNLADKLNELWIQSVYFTQPGSFQSFQRMLLSLTRLKFFAFTSWSLTSSDPIQDMNRALILPPH